jgi:hypothetical protein
MVSPAVALKHLTSKRRVCKKWKNETEDWSSERIANLEEERKKDIGRTKKKNTMAKMRKADNLKSHPAKQYTRVGTSIEREKRSKRVEQSVSGKKLNLYFDSLPNPLHLEDVSKSTFPGITDQATLPRIFRIRGLPLVHFFPILVTLKGKARAGAFQAIRKITGTHTEQFYLSSADGSLPKGEAVVRSWRKACCPITVCAIDSLAWSILNALPGLENPGDWSVEVGFLTNCKDNGAVHQTLHLDVPEALNFEPSNKIPYIVHIPLCNEGMALQIVGEDGCYNPPLFRYYALGEAAVLRADVWHGGSYGTKGNMRMRMILTHHSFPCDRQKDKLQHLRKDLPDTSTWPPPNDILKLAQHRDLANCRCLQTNWYRNRVSSACNGPEFLSQDYLSNLK